MNTTTERKISLDNIPGEALGNGLPDFPEWCQTFNERKAYQHGVAHARYVDRHQPLAQDAEKPQIRLDFHWANGADTSFIGVYETTVEGFETGDLPECGDFMQFPFDDNATGKALETVLQRAVDAANAAQPKTRHDAIMAAVVSFLSRNTTRSNEVLNAASKRVLSRLLDEAGKTTS